MFHPRCLTSARVATGSEVVFLNPASSEKEHGFFSLQPFLRWICSSLKELMEQGLTTPRKGVGLTARHGDFASEMRRSELMKRCQVQCRAILKSFSN